jgi:sec-independent protein translocase protein TatC
MVVFYLTVFNIVPYKKLRGSWRVVYIALMLISAMVTPDASPVTMILMFAAMTALYEGSLLLSRIVLHKRIKAQEAEAKVEAEAEAAEEAKLAKARAEKAAADNTD